ncbi:MAG: beta-lactamase family protein [Clostridia bacterium]|nr:beta-lactamase family protein [Clostridia bacterium]
MEKFPKLTKYLEELHREKNARSCGLIVCKNHEKIYEKYLGFADEKMGKKADGKTLYFMYSCTKPMTVAAGLMLCERGVISLDSPVAKYLPEMASAFVLKNGEKVCVGEKMLVRHLFTMSAGFDYSIASREVSAIVKNTGGKASTREMMAAFAAMPLGFEPGERFRYSLCHDVLAAVIEAASGMRFADFMRENIFAPLGMENTYYHLPREEREARMASLWKWDAGVMREFGKNNAYELTENYDSGGAGLISCAEDYAVFADAMACGGVAKNGVRILREETVRAMASDALHGFVKVPESFSSVVGAGYNYGLGVRVLADKKNGTKAPLGEFGWDGAGGCCFTADPENGISMIFTEHLFCWPDAQGAQVHVNMRNAFYEDYFG